MLESTERRKTYTCLNGSTGPYPVTFPVLTDPSTGAALNLTIKLINASGTETDITSTCTVTGLNVYTGSIYDDTYTLVIIRETPRTQETDYTTGDTFDGNQLEDDFDKLMMIAAEADDDKIRSLSAPTSEDVEAGDLEIPSAASRANKYLTFDADGNPQATDSGVDPTPVTDFIETLLDDEDAATARTTLGLGTAAVEDVGTGNGLDADKVDGADKSTDGELSGNSDDALPTEKAINTQLDTHIKPFIQAIITNSWTAASAAEANTWSSVCWSPELELFCAVSADGTSRVMTSPDGINWTARTAAEANNWQSVTWSPELELFCAVSLGGTHQVMTSPDGITWTARTAAEANTWQSVTWSPGLALFCAVAGTGTNRVMTSPDGINWTARAAAEANPWESIAWSPELELFCAVASFGTNRVMTSPDGITWTTRTAAEASDWMSVAWSPALGLFCAVGTGGTYNVMTSPDGITWTSQTAADSNNWKDICWSPELELFCAVRYGGTDSVMVSRDGIVWQSRDGAEASDYCAITWSRERGMFCVVAGGGTNRVMYTLPSP